ncbi:alpha/beta fold hydrolase [Luteibacter sp. 3190]|uniref:alpha/beta fold hydrolase n=1 Tax=Luteibacter sp. 3190 TaxID=2817736 RepID=UPI0028597118|nr:alpha/beta fold hydrolase [Luteibacter sp. 3190]MDR6937387.1 pimeloyl-ACP methyl ester carboxylesterase [Luteibacter sp. 3190]
MKTIVSLTLLAGALAAALPAAAESVAPLSWTACGAAAPDVASRTECARLIVPRDYADPTSGTLELDVVRVVADSARGDRHDGTLLLEPDEFADPVRVAVPAMAASWRAGDDAWRELSRRMDLVGLAPRRMDDAQGHDCLSATAALPRHRTLGIDMTDANFAAADQLAVAIAAACRNDPMHDRIGTEPRIADIERLREALGQERLHILATGRGGWVAARYAERHPRHVDRLVLDGSWDIDGSVAEAMEARIAERGRTLRRAISDLVEAPARYGWGSDAADVRARIARIPPAWRAAWGPGMVDAVHVAAALAMGRQLDADAGLTAAALGDALATAPLAPDAVIARDVRAAAASLLAAGDRQGDADAYGFGPRAVDAAPARIASVFAARCNDGYWGADSRYWHERMRELDASWPGSVGNELFQGMVCSYWPGAFGPSSVPVLMRSFLMVHAEFDAEAPLRGAAMSMQTHANAKLVVARGLRGHSVATRHDRPCVSGAVARYLGEGVLPSMPLTNCRPPENPPAK